MKNLFQNKRVKRIRVIWGGRRAKRRSSMNMAMGKSNSIKGGGGRGGNIKGRSSNKAVHKKRNSIMLQYFTIS